MSIIAAGTTTTTALSSTGNTDGTLQFQVNGTTASVTLNTLGAIGVGSTPAFGTSGQVLISGGSTAAPTWGTPATATTATNLAGGSNGTIPYQSASGTTQMLAVGTSGQVLQTNGAGAPSWATPSSGAMVFISSVTVTSSVSTIDIENAFTAYDEYVIKITELRNDTGGITMNLRVKYGGAYDTDGNYGSGGQLAAYNGVTTQGGIGNSSIFIFSNANTFDSVELYVHKPSSTLKKTFHWTGVAVSSNTPTAVYGAGLNSSTSQLQGVRIYCPGALFTSGVVRLYGIANS